MNALARGLSERDLTLLDLVSKHHFLTGRHVSQLLFSSAHLTQDSGERTARRVLARLVELRVLEHLARRIGGVRAGSSSYVFRVGLVGDQLLRQRDGQGPRARRKEPSLRHLDHCLAVADCHVLLADAARTGSFELLVVETEPAAWRRYPTLAGTTETLKPDLYAVTASGEFQDFWFLECDRGTESLPTLLRKCQPYEGYRRTGQEQQRHGVFPRVIWVVPDHAQAQRLTRAISRQRGLDSELFRVTTLDRLAGLIAKGAG